MTLLTLLTIFAGGCAHQGNHAKDRPSVLLALRVAGGGGPPTQQQVSRIHHALESQVAQAGLRFAETIEEADFVLSANFTPDPADPLRGQLDFVGLAPSGRKAGGESHGVSREARLKFREIERWFESQLRNYPD